MKLSLLFSVLSLGLSISANASSLFCQSQMAKAVDETIQSQVSAQNPGKKIEVFESSTSNADGYIGAGGSNLLALKNSAATFGTVKGSYYIGGFRTGGQQMEYEASVYLTPGTCDVITVEITKTTPGGVLE